jgi:hypothetical protein
MWISFPGEEMTVVEGWHKKGKGQQSVTQQRYLLITISVPDSWVCNFLQ